jgi:hypothetical protein
MAAVTRDIRGIPLWLLRDYLVDLGGVARGDDEVEGPGWRVRLSRLPDYRIGSLRVGETRMELSAADQPTLDQLERNLWPKLLRGGG